MDRIPKRRKVSQTILQSLRAGQVPRSGVEHIAVGRRRELTELLSDLDIVFDGGAAFRVIVGRYGAGKSFMLQLLRNEALKQRFVVADADISPQRRLTGSKGEGLALYRELLRTMSTRTRPNGNALGPLIEKWLDVLQTRLMRDGVDPDSIDFERKLTGRVHQIIGEVETLTYGFDFAEVLKAYTSGHRSGNDELKRAALRWLRGEFNSRTEARQALGGKVRVMIDDATWYDNIKIIAYFARQVGYRGLLIFIDETVYLSRISNRSARENNYNRLLAMVNDAMQGHAEHLGIYLGATPEAVEDRRRGFFSNEALETRLRESSFAGEDLVDLSGPLIRLDIMGEAALRELLQTVRDIHAWHYRYESPVQERHIDAFLRQLRQRIGADNLLTPREVVIDFLSVLSLLRQHRRASFESLLGMVNFETGSQTHKEATEEESLFSEFAL